LVTTFMVCPATNKAERTYLRLLHNVTSWARNNDHDFLVLFSDQTETLHFKRT
jgi:hypothetical protein